MKKFLSEFLHIDHLAYVTIAVIAGILLWFIYQTIDVIISTKKAVRFYERLRADFDKLDHHSDVRMVAMMDWPHHSKVFQESCWTNLDKKYLPEWARRIRR